MINYGYIYKTTNLDNNKVYIGQKKGKFNPEYFGSGTILKKAITKYSPLKFKLEILVYCNNKEEINKLEKEFIKKYRELLGKNNLYNITDGGEGFKSKHSEISKKKIGFAASHISEKTRQKMSISRLGNLNPAKKSIVRKKLSIIGNKKWKDSTFINNQKNGLKNWWKKRKEI